MNKNFITRKISNIRSLIFLSIALLFIATLVFGCGPYAKFIKTGPTIDVKPSDCNIEVFNSKIPDRKYEELGILEIDGVFGYNTFEDVLPKLKEKACEQGGDAFIIKNIQKYVEGKNDNIYVTATVIKWKE